MIVHHELVKASRTGQPIRIHKSDGEVLVVRVLRLDADRVTCRVLTSSRPENHAVCDSTGFPIEHSNITRVRLLEEPRDA